MTQPMTDEQVAQAEALANSVLDDDEVLDLMSVPLDPHDIERLMLARAVLHLRSRLAAAEQEKAQYASGLPIITAERDEARAKLGEVRDRLRKVTSGAVGHMRVLLADDDLTAIEEGVPDLVNRVRLMACRHEETTKQLADLTAQRDQAVAGYESLKAIRSAAKKVVAERMSKIIGGCRHARETTNMCALHRAIAADCTESVEYGAHKEGR